MNRTSKAIDTEPQVFEQRKIQNEIMRKEPIIGSSPSVLKIRQQTHFAIEMNMSVFITGEVGTEKVELAEFIHQKSRIPSSRFIRISSNFSVIVAFFCHLFLLLAFILIFHCFSSVIVLFVVPSSAVFYL